MPQEQPNYLDMIMNPRKHDLAWSREMSPEKKSKEKSKEKVARDTSQLNTRHSFDMSNLDVPIIPMMVSRKRPNI